MKEDETVLDAVCFEKRANSSLLFLKSLTILQPACSITVYGESKLTLKIQVRLGAINGG
jgi:hypothetical protein